MLERVEINKSKPLKPGDLIELEYKTVGKLWIPAIQIAMVEWKFTRRKDWAILSTSLPEAGRITFRVLIKNKYPDEPELQRAGIGVTAIMISAAICAVGLVTWLSLDKVYQLVEKMDSPSGKIAMAGIGSVGIALLIYVISQYVKFK